MNPQPPPPPSDDELDRLLAGRLRHVSPGFELRWRELRGGFVARRRRRPAWRAWLLWPGLAVGLAAVAVMISTRDPRRMDAAAPGAFEELIALDAALAPGSVLLESETRDALLHLPAESDL